MPISVPPVDTKSHPFIVYAVCLYVHIAWFCTYPFCLGSSRLTVCTHVVTERLKTDCFCSKVDLTHFADKLLRYVYSLGLRPFLFCNNFK